jgi:hypothetical protein
MYTYIYVNIYRPETMKLASLYVIHICVEMNIQTYILQIYIYIYIYTYIYKYIYMHVPIYI